MFFAVQIENARDVYVDRSVSSVIPSRLCLETNRLLVVLDDVVAASVWL